MAPIKDVEPAVWSAIVQVSKRKGVDLGEPLPSARLPDLGLKSLDIAEVMATLEIQFGLNPFATLVDITTARTVQDFFDAYRRCAELTEGDPNESVHEADDAGRARAARRLERENGERDTSGKLGPR